MEALWKSEVFTADDLRVFRYREDPAEDVNDNVPQCTVFNTSTTGLRGDPDDWLPKSKKRKLNEWNQWLETASPENKKGEYFALIMAPIPPPKRPSRSPGVVNSAVLKNLSICKDSFELIVKKLSLHHALAVIIDRGVPTISRIKTKINGKNCYVYTLRVEHTLKDQTAMTITHFQELPKSSNSSTSSQPIQNVPAILQSETYALVLSYNDADIAKFRKCLENCKESIFNPFTLIKAFLCVERGHRFIEVDHKVVNFQNILQNYGRLPLGADQTHDINQGSVEDPKNLIGLYLDLCTLKNRLLAWTKQITGLQNHASDFACFATGEPEIDPTEYLQRMVDEFEVKINKCEMVLQGASLAFQMETAHLARGDTARSIELAQLSREDAQRSIDIAKLARLDSRLALRDGKQMKAIALLTMVFLPGTFIATLLAVPVFADMTKTTAFAPWWWYLILFLPLTAIVLMIYLLWIYYYKSKEQKSLDDNSKWKVGGIQ